MLVHNWREVLKRAWSVRLMALLFIIIEPVYTFVAATWVSRNIYIQRRKVGETLSRRKESATWRHAGYTNALDGKPCEYFVFHLTG
ncbi:DUF7940 domain-containing protein [Rhizobium acaciae]|uniref:DUF7940 domain-containing protein n=1 Tax=Rhizobium acaciae TaxID=2989736 RepID=UPI00222111E7|nr:hypothetical protein [Rhizobium acaciae]MCW1751204.1 hypothetical protein [Rhizobium acaciae]